MRDVRSGIGDQDLIGPRLHDPTRLSWAFGLWHVEDQLGQLRLQRGPSRVAGSQYEKLRSFNVSVTSADSPVSSVTFVECFQLLDGPIEP